jgi:hypothetical protein
VHRLKSRDELADAIQAVIRLARRWLARRPDFEGDGGQIQGQGEARQGGESCLLNLATEGITLTPLRGGQFFSGFLPDMMLHDTARDVGGGLNEQFRTIRGPLVTIVVLLGLITGILLALAWEYL